MKLGILEAKTGFEAADSDSRLTLLIEGLNSSVVYTRESAKIHPREGSKRAGRNTAQNWQGWPAANSGRQEGAVNQFPQNAADSGSTRSPPLIPSHRVD